MNHPHHQTRASIFSTSTTYSVDVSRNPESPQTSVRDLGTFSPDALAHGTRYDADDEASTLEANIHLESRSRPSELNDTSHQSRGNMFNSPRSGSMYGDPLKVTLLAQDFQLLINGISSRVKHLSDVAKQSSLSTFKQCEQNQVHNVDVSIQNLKQLIAQCEELEVEFLKISQIGEIAEDFKRRIVKIESRLVEADAKRI